MQTKLKLKSISLLIPFQKVSASISQLDFSLDGITTIAEYDPPADSLLTLKLPSKVMVFDVKNMVRVIDSSSYF